MRSLKEIPGEAKRLLEQARARWPAVDVTLSTFKSFSLADGGAHSAALTYYAFFSLFPFVLFSVAVLGFVTGGNDELRDQIISAGEDAVPLISDVLTEDTLARIESRATNLALLSAVMALYSGTGAIVALQHALNRTHGLIEEPGWLQKRLRALKFVALFGAGVILSIALGALAGVLPRVLGPAGAVVSWLGARAAGFTVGLFIFGGIYMLLPALERTWRDVLPGAIVAAAAFEVLKEVGAWFVERGSQSREATFGAFALAAGLLVACYLIAQITLICAHVNKVLMERKISRRGLAAATRED